MAVGIDKPPLSIDLLDTEETCSFGLRRFISAIFAVTVRIERKAFDFLRPIPLQLVQTGNFPWPISGNPLAKFINHGQLLKDLRTGVLLCQLDRADLDDGMIERVIHHECQCLNLRDGSKRAPDREPEGVEGAISR